jgi:hypothetical protein
MFQAGLDWQVQTIQVYVLCIAACRYLQLLASQQQPFTFAQEDAEAAAAKASKRAAALDPNRFQVGYRNGRRIVTEQRLNL